jgi:O-antigen/teichoic acid export membrane protein
VVAQPVKEGKRISTASVPDGGRQIMRGAYATAAGFAVRLGARLLFLFIAGRLFGATALGAFLLATAVVELAVAVANLGTKKLLFPLLDDRREREPGHIVLDAAVPVVVAAAMLALPIGALALVLPGPGLMLAIVAPMIAGQALLDLFLAATRWRGAVRFEVVGRSILEPYAGVAGTLTAWWLGAGTLGLAWGYVVGTLAALAYAVRGAQGALDGFGLRRWRPSWPIIVRLLAMAKANTASDALTALYQRLDLYLVGLLLGPGAAGLYGMARQVSVPIRQIRQSFDGLLIPLVARSAARDGGPATGAALASAARLVLAIQLPVVLALVATGEPLLEAFGPGFGVAYTALVLLAAAEAVQAAFGTGDLLFVYLNPRVGLTQTIVGIGVGVGVAVMLLPAVGITGGAIAVLAGYLVRAAMRAWALRRRLGVTVPLAHPAGPLIAAAAGAAAIVVTAPAGDWIGLAAGLSAYAGVILLWLRVTGESLRLRGFSPG